MKARHLTERTDFLSPGIYTADSDTSGYGSLMAALEQGSAVFLGEDYISNDLKSVAIEVKSGAAVRSNPDDTLEGFEQAHVEIGDDFYTRALREYTPPILCLVRELAQNSVDAGARVNAPHRTTIEIKTEDQPDGSQIFTFKDDAGGMTLDILRNKFLKISESGKRGDPGATGSAGGFGIAKELILFPWLSYEVHTQDNLLRGKKGKYGFKKTEMLNGTLVKLHMPADYKVTAADVIAVIERSHLPLTRFVFNGEIVRADAKVDPADEVGEGTFNGRGKMHLYYRPKARKTTGFYVRKTVCAPSGDFCGSLFMFSQPIESSIPGCFFLDITGSSLETMLANRMSLHAPWSYELASYLRSLVKDKHNATRRKNNAMHRAWTGGAKFVPKAEAAGKLAAVMSQFTGSTEAFKEATNVEGIAKILRENAEQRAKEEAGEVRPPDSASVDGPQHGEEVAETKEEKEDEEQGGPEIRVVYTAIPEMAEIAAALVPEGKPGSPEKAIKLMAVEYDFYIHNEIEGCSCGHSRERHEHGGKLGECLDYNCDCTRFAGFRVPKRFMPTDKDGKPSMSPTLRKISRFWGEVCRAVLIAADKPQKSFGVGWMFDTEYRDGEYRTTEGEYIRANNENWLLLNPYRGGNIKDGELFRLRNDADLKWIYGIAVHECAHLTYGEGGHDEGYARELTELIAKAAGVPKFLRTIRDACVKRPVGWVPKAKPAPKPKPVRFKPDLEAVVLEAEKDFRKDTTWASLRIPSKYELESEKSRWSLGRSYSTGGKYVQKIGRSGAIGTDETLYRSEEYDRYNKEDERAVTADTLLRLRSMIAAAYGGDVRAAEIDEDLASSIEMWERDIIEKLTDGDDPYAIEIDGGTTGEGQKIAIEAQRSGSKYDVSLHIAGKYVTTRETASVPKSKPGWQKGAARAILKVITPILAERWRTK